MADYELTPHEPLPLRNHLKHILMASSLLIVGITGCSLGGIRAPDGWDPPPIKECYKTVNNTCYTRQEWEDFIRKTFGREYL